MLILIFSEIIIKEKNFSQNFLIDNLITKYIYKKYEFLKEKSGSIQISAFFRGGLIFLHQRVLQMVYVIDFPVFTSENKST